MFKKKVISSMSFALLGSVQVKAVCKMLVKLTSDGGPKTFKEMANGYFVFVWNNKKESY
jgi:hypothetical protein